MGKGQFIRKIIMILSFVWVISLSSVSVFANSTSMDIRELEFGEDSYIFEVGDIVDLKELLDIDREIYERIYIEWTGNTREDLGSIDSDGFFQFESEGVIEVTASYEDLVTKADFVVGKKSDVSVQRRAILIGNTDYLGDEEDLKGPRYDIRRMETIFSSSAFGDAGEFSYIEKYEDISKTELEDAINHIADVVGPEDITYFYYSGHGMRYEDMSYLKMIDEYVSVVDLKAYLDTMPGIKVVILDCCNSGGFINKSASMDSRTSRDTIDELEAMDKNIIETFAIIPKSTGYMNEGSYKVLTASSAEELSVDVNANPPYGLFTKILVDSSGYYGNYPSDLDGNGGVTLSETYEYIYDRVLRRNPTQHAQIYPEKSTFEWMSYKQIRDVAVENIYFDQEKIEIKEFDSGNIKANIEPTDATNDSIYYQSLNPEILSVDGEGHYRAIKAGETKVVATSIDGLYKAEQTIVVEEFIDPDEGVEFYKDLTINDSEKMWTIDFTVEVDIESIDEGIYISESRDGAKIGGLDFKIKDKSVLLYPPIGGWEYDKYYYLNVNQELKSVSGQNLNESKIVRFRLN